MRKIRTVFAMAAVMTIATLSLTAAVSAATAMPQSTNEYTQINGSWYITEPSYDVLAFGRSYSPAKYSSLKVGNGVASITGLNYYDGNYKYVSTSLRSATNTTRSSKSGTTETVANSRPSLPSGTITKATYNAELRAGVRDGCDILDSFIVQVNKSNT